jgi:Tfp pilus assembly protein PilV
MNRFPETKGRRRGQAGLTLVETLVYAALSMAIMSLAVWSLSGLQKGAGRSQEMARLHGSWPRMRGTWA